MPRGEIGGASLDGSLICFLIGVPIFPFLPVSGREFPSSVWILFALKEAFLLLFFADMEEELENDGAGVGQHLLKLVDVVVPLLDDVRFGELVDLDDKDIFVVASIEDHNLALPRSLLVDAPEVVVAKLFLGWPLEACDAGGNDVAHFQDMAYRSILAGGVHALEDDEDRPLGREEKGVFKAGEFIGEVFDLFEGFFFRVVAFDRSSDPGELDLGTWLDCELGHRFEDTSFSV